MESNVRVTVIITSGEKVLNSLVINKDNDVTDSSPWGGYGEEKFLSPLSRRH